MGGYQSGKRYGARRRVEQCIALDSSWMLQNNYFDLGVGRREYHVINWAHHACEPIYSLSADLARISVDEMRLDMHTTRQVVYLYPTALHFGGVRWWFGCPGCRRRCAKLYYLRASVFSCRICHDLTYQTCIEGKSTNSFVAATSAQLGLSVAGIKKAIAEETRALNPWRRKRDRRASYKERGPRLRRIPEKSLKLAILEAKVMSDIAKTLGRMGGR